MIKLARSCLLLVFIAGCLIEPIDDPPRGDSDPMPCARTPAGPNDPRFVVAARPYDSAGDFRGSYEVLALSPAGDLTTTGKNFQIGYTTDGYIQFTPDGDVGLVAHHGNLGTLGVFRLAANGTPTVVHEEYDGDNHDLWVSAVTVHPDGNRAIVVDGNWQTNGGGLYEINIACDGTITERGLLIESKLAEAVYYLPNDPDRIVVVAKEIGPENAPVSDASDDVHLIDISGAATWVGGADLFPDDDHIVMATALTANGRHILVADGASFSGLDHRMGVAEILMDDIVFAQEITPLPFDNPGGLSASPFDNTVLLVTWHQPNDAATWFPYDPDGISPLGAPSEVAYLGLHGAPQMAGATVVITRGDLTGRIFISENVKVRQMQFLAASGVVDVDALDFGEGTEAMVGAIGVQP